VPEHTVWLAGVAKSKMVPGWVCHALGFARATGTVFMSPAIYNSPLLACNNAPLHLLVTPLSCDWLCLAAGFESHADIMGALSRAEQPVASTPACSALPSKQKPLSLSTPIRIFGDEHSEPVL